MCVINTSIHNPKQYSCPDIKLKRPLLIFHQNEIVYNNLVYFKYFSLLHHVYSYCIAQILLVRNSVKVFIKGHNDSNLNSHEQPQFNVYLRINDAVQNDYKIVLTMFHAAIHQYLDLKGLSKVSLIQPCPAFPCYQCGDERLLFSRRLEPNLKILFTIYQS